MELTNLVVTYREDALQIGDYHTYQAQLSRKLHSLRKRLGETTPPPKGKGKGKTKQLQTKQQYTPKKATVTAEDVARDSAYVYLPLLSAERAWATAMQMKSVHSADPSSKGIVGSTRKHIISRLNKAVAHASMLVSVFEGDEPKQLDLLEARGYVASLTGAYWMEKQRWEQCLEQYALAKVVYGVLGNKSPQRTVLRDFVEGTIVPGLRYAAYQLQVPRTTSLDALAVRNFPQDVRAEVLAADPECLNETAEATATTAETTQATTSGVEAPRTLTWRNRTITIEDSSISLALGAAYAAAAELTSYLQKNQGTPTTSSSTSHLSGLYDRVIGASQDAVDATKTAIEELTAEGVDQGDARMQALQVTRTAVNYELVSWRIGRNRAACGEDDGLAFEPWAGVKKGALSSRRARKLAARADSVPKRLDVLRRRVALYDATVQDLEGIKELPGVMGDVQLVEELEAKKNYFRALRCVAIARSHAILSKPGNALALLVHASRLAEAAAPLISNGDANGDDNGPLRLNVTHHQLSTLIARLESLVTQHQALCELARLAATTNSNHLPPMVERLDTYERDVDLKRLVNFPPKLQPIPVKPLFLDVAWNYLQYPGVKEESRGMGFLGKAAGLVSAVKPEEEEDRKKKEGRRSWFPFGRS